MGFEKDKEKRLKDALRKAYPVTETKSERFRSLLERLASDGGRMREPG